MQKLKLADRRTQQVRYDGRGSGRGSKDIWLGGRRKEILSCAESKSANERDPP